MEDNKKHCYSCAHYSAYYLKADIQFVKTKTGYCREKGKITPNCEVCENWNYGGCGIYKIDFRKTQRALVEILYNLAAIRQIVEEDDNEN